MATTAKRVAIYATVVLGTALAAVSSILLLPGDRIPEVDFKQVSPENSSVPDNDDRPVLKIAIGAMISPKITKRYYEDLLKLLGSKVGRHTQLIQRKTYAEVNDLIEKREVDLAFVCAGPYVQGHDKFGLELLAVPIVEGRNVYHSYILANIAGDIRTFDNLRGKRFAFTDPDSNTGCLVPKYMLAKRGESPESFFRETFFTYSHDNSIKAVGDNLADGAAVDSLIWDFMRATDPASVSKTVIIEKSPPYGIPPLVVHPATPPSLKAELKRVLLSIHRDPTAESLLSKVRIERFEEGNDSLYDTVREMQSWQDENQR